MSTREIAYSIFEQLGEEELKGFIALFSKIYPPKTENIGNYAEFGGTSDDIEERKAAFARLDKLRREIPDLDEKKELEEYRKEKYGV